MSISPSFFFFSKIFCRIKTDETQVDCYLKIVQLMVTLTNHDIARVGFILRGTLSTSKIFARYFCHIQVKTKKSEVESRTQGSRPRPRTQKKSEAKAKDSLSEDRHSRGQGQECSRPRPRTKDTSASAL